MSFMCGEQWLETGNPFIEVDMSESQIEWLKAENSRLMKENEQLMKDVHRIDSARQAAVSQCAVMADDQTVKDYAIWQAITDLESRCRHRSSGLQIEIEDKEHEPVVSAALLILAECGVDVVRDAKFPNIKINYDRSKNQFFGRA